MMNYEVEEDKNHKIPHSESNSSVLLGSPPGSRLWLAGASENCLSGPLMNDVILKTMFEACAWKELNTFRTVCRHWYDSSLPIWRHKAPTIVVKGYDEKSTSRLTKAINSAAAAAAAAASNSSYEFRGFAQYQHFKLEGFKKGSNQQYQQDFLDLFWTHCGKWMTTLELEFVEFGNVTELRNVLTCRHTPKLEKLKLAVIYYPFHEADEQVSAFNNANSEPVPNKHLKLVDIEFSPISSKFPMSWTDFLQLYPRLQHVKLAFPESDWMTETNQVFHAITKIRSTTDKTKLALKSLDILVSGAILHAGEYRLHPSLDAYFLRDSQLFLETMRLDLAPDTCVEHLSRVLSTLSTSLRKLTLSGTEPLLDNFNFPTMSSLTHLKLLEAPFQNLHFLKNSPCPKLESLSWVAQTRTVLMMMAETNDQVMQGLVIPSLRSFQYYETFWLSAMDICRLHGWMPNLTTLKLILRNDSLAMVCKLWPALESLTTHPFHITDEGVTGIPRGCEKFGVRLYPNVTDLKNLKCLHILQDVEVGGAINKSALTEKSILFGFLQMPQLIHASFEADIITSNAVKLLKTNIPSALVRYNHLV